MRAGEHYSEQPVELDKLYRELDEEGFDVRPTFAGVLRALTPGLGKGPDFRSGLGALGGLKVEDDEGKVYCKPLKASYFGDVDEDLQELVEGHYDASYMDLGLRHPLRGTDF